MFEQLFNNPFLYSLSLTLVHFLWQGLLVGLILKSVLLIITKNKSKLRYGLATFAMLSNAILAIFTFAIVYPEASSGIKSNLNPIPLASLVDELTQQNVMLTYQELIPSILAYSLPYLSLFWLTTVVVLACKLLIEIRNVNNLPLHASVSPSSDLLARFDELAKQIKLPSTPKLLISLKADVPMAIGWLKPVVLLPATMVTGLTSAQLEMLILHELAHIRRHDYLVNFLQTLIELLFFFHPSVHWIGKQMRNEREYCSDDIAVQHCGDAIAYAHTLTDTASLCVSKCTKSNFQTIPTMAMAASGGDLKERVLRLVDHHCAPSNDTSKWLAAISLLTALILLSINQLLTMPFTNHLSNEFPWQESRQLNKGIVQSTSGLDQVQKFSSEEGFIPLANNSIAIQLLSRKGALAQNSLVEVFDSKTNQELKTHTLLTPILSPIVFDTGALKTKVIIDEPYSSKVVLQSSPVTTLNRTRSKLIEHTLQTSNNPLNSKGVKLANQEPKQNNSTLKAVNPTILSIKTEQNQKQKTVIASLPLAEENPSTTSRTIDVFTLNNDKPVISKVDKSIEKQSIESTQIDLLANVPPKKSVGFINEEKNKSPINSIQSYVQELNEFELENDQNTVFRTLNSPIDIISTEDELQLNVQESIKSIDAILLNSASPIYPNLAKRRGIEMEVKVHFTIDRNGKVKDINFEQQNKITYFKSAIRSAIRKWRFTPATKNNDIIESKMSKIFSFSLQS